jgi:hypothetical protein
MPSTAEANQDGVVDRLSASHEGSLAGTPFAACLADEMTGSLLRVAPPSPTAAAKTTRALELPRGPAGLR